MHGVVRSVCISERKGTQKEPVSSITLIPGHGIEGDAHAGNWHRQVSLLSYDKIKEFKERGADVSDGAFGENIIIEGIDLGSLPVGTRFRIGGDQGALLELTQIGKECHSHCAIYHAVGDCIMPREGVFTVVIEGGTVREGDDVMVIEADKNRAYTAVWITLSDKGYAGEREDKSGPVIDRMLREAGYEVVENILLPDDQRMLEAQLIRLADQRQVDLILTTGGTGFAERDRTPEATINVCDRMAPGIAEAMRAFSMTITPRAMLSRAASGIRKKSLIVNLPGSPKAVEESLGFILPALDHGLDILRGTGGECAR